MNMIALDLDGTLLNSAGEISEVNQQAVRAAYQQGIQITLATGRSVISARQILAQLGVEGHIIALNGAVAFLKNAERPFFAGEIPQGMGLDILDLATQNQVVMYGNNLQNNYQVSAVATAAETVVQEFQEKRVVRQGITYAQMDELLRIKQESFLKFALTSTNKTQLQQLQQRLKAQQIPAVLSDTHYIEIMAHQVNKGTSLERLCQHLNMPLKDVVAFGDQENDLQMIQKVGQGLAMGNAVSALKKVANRVIDTNNHSAVGHEIQRLLKRS